MNTEITVKAYAKINLSLEVVRKRPDGYHDILSVMQDLGLHDIITISTDPNSWQGDRAEYSAANCILEGVHVQFCMNYSAISLGPDNLACKGISAVLKAIPQQLSRPDTIYLSIDKRLPVAAGIAGGSGNAAACMLATNALLGYPLSLRELMQVGGKVGADVPFSLMMNAKKNEKMFPSLSGIEEASVAAETAGIGEIVRPIAPRSYSVILMNPGIAVSTKEVYEAIDAEASKEVVEDLFFNRMEEYTLEHYDEAAALKNCMKEHLHADQVLMSGSGPTMVAYYNSKALAERDYQEALQGNWLKPDWKIWLTESGEIEYEN